MTRVGLYFGSFNPVHEGHLAIANYMLEKAPIDKLWFVLSPQNPLKNPDDLWPVEKRLKLLRSAIDNLPKTAVCTIEWEMQKPSYTINTLQRLSERYPHAKFCIIMGADTLQNIDQWKDFEKILQTYEIFVYPRPDIVPNAHFKHPNITLFDAPLMNISSTQIRKQRGCS